AIHQRRSANCRLQRRRHHAVAERNGHRMNLLPHTRLDGTRYFRQFRLQAVEKTDLFQERTVAFDADGIGLAARTDVGREDEDFRQRQHTALAVEVPDGLATEHQRTRRIKTRVQVELAGIERHRRGKALDGRAHFIGACRHAVQAILVQRMDRIVRVEIRHRCHGDDFAGLDVQHNRTGGNRPIAFHGLDQHVAHDVLHANVYGETHRFQRLPGRKTNGAQVGQALAVDIFLHASNALIVDIDETEDVRSGWATRIETALFRPETDARYAERHDLALLARRQPALDPDEARAAFQALVCRFP